MISVVVATARRPGRLAACLAALAADVPGEPREVVVADNAPDDPATRAAAEDAGAVWVPEPRPGKSHALNRGVAAAGGDVVLFTDDDVLVRPGWSDALAAAARRPGVGVAGGRLLPRWEAPPPDWLLGPPAVHLTLTDHGDTERELPFAYGAAMAVPRAVLHRLAPAFDPRLGPHPRRKTGYEEVLLAARVRALGLAVVHVPAAVAEHCIDPRRLDRARLRRLVLQSGFGAARCARLTGAALPAYPVRVARVGVSAVRAARLAAYRGPLTATHVDRETGAWAALGRRVEDLVGPIAPGLADRLAEVLAGRGPA